MNKVFIATSMDGFIADKNGGIEWLHSVPNPDGIDMGYAEFMSGIDAIVMGRNTFETVLGFDIDWPYDVPVFVLSRTLNEIPNDLSEKVFLIQGALPEILSQIREQGYHHLYIDGGTTIQGFLKDDLIEEMTITIIPILLGQGIPLFSDRSNSLEFECIDSKIFLDQVVQNTFRRSR